MTNAEYRSFRSFQNVLVICAKGICDHLVTDAPDASMIEDTLILLQQAFDAAMSEAEVSDEAKRLEREKNSTEQYYNGLKDFYNEGFQKGRDSVLNKKPSADLIKEGV